MPRARNAEGYGALWIAKAYVDILGEKDSLVKKKRPYTSLAFGDGTTLTTSDHVSQLSK
jgi:hypothetical protein